MNDKEIRLTDQIGGFGAVIDHNITDHLDPDDGHSLSTSSDHLFNRSLAEIDCLLPFIINQTLAEGANETLSIADDHNSLHHHHHSTLSSLQAKAAFGSLSGSWTEDDLDADYRGCNRTFDRVSCWPSTPPNTVATISCFPELHGIPYDTTKNATRLCHENGTWAAKADYSACKPIISHEDEFLKSYWDVKDAATIYYVGYGLSLIAIVIALWIFLYFKDLRCVRNTIHTNLMLTYLFTDLIWIITATLQSCQSAAAHKASCFLMILLTYLMCTNFFWMFVEGLYLYILVVKTFSIELVKIHYYVFIGWGIPAIVVLIWAFTKAYFSQAATAADLILQPGCIWQGRDHFDYIFISPVLIVLLVNIFFLCKIMWVLITKLRAATTAESKRYRKSAKALLVLIPLLGVAYVLFIVTPNEGFARRIFTYLQATTLSTQGFTVAVLYCFLNNEVRNSIRHHFDRWKTMRTLRHSTGGAHSLSMVGHHSAPANLHHGTSCQSATDTDEKFSISPAIALKTKSRNKKKKRNRLYRMALGGGSGSSGGGRSGVTVGEDIGPASGGSGSSASMKLYRNRRQSSTTDYHHSHYPHYPLHQHRGSCVSFATSSTYVSSGANTLNYNHNHQQDSSSTRNNGHNSDSTSAPIPQTTFPTGSSPTSYGYRLVQVINHQSQPNSSIQQQLANDDGSEDTL